MASFIAPVGRNVFRLESHGFKLRRICSANYLPISTLTSTANLERGWADTVEISSRESLHKIHPVPPPANAVKISHKRLKKLSNILVHKFNDLTPLATAMVHKSVTGHPKASHKVYCEIKPGLNAEILENNERLELLGDRVLALLVSKHLLTSSENELSVGEMGRAVSSICSRRAVSYYLSALELEKFMVITGKAVEKNNYSRGDFLEAFLGAIYIDGGLEAAERFFEMRLKPLFPSDHAEYKSVLQELLAKFGLPAHKVNDFMQYFSYSYKKKGSGAVHTRAIKLFGRTVTKATGSSYTIADQKAAQQLVQMLKNNDDRTVRILDKLSAKSGLSKEPTSTKLTKR